MSKVKSQNNSNINTKSHKTLS